jgi:membrane-associated phospholipid phosphatase
MIVSPRLPGEPPLTEPEADRPARRKASLSPRQRVTWNDDWQKFGVGDAVGAGIGIAAAIGSLVIPPKALGSWTGKNDLDTEVRAALRLTSLEDRNTATDASDVLLALSSNQLLIDTLIVTWWGHDNGEVAWQMALMDVQTLAINAGMNGLVSGLTSRQRPYGTALVDDPSEGDLCEVEDEFEDCRANNRFRSFYSGHTSTTFAVAGLTCMHHAYLPLYGGVGDPIACVAGFALAGGTGVLRMVADRHWATDVLAGAAIGTFNGLFWPWVLHYRTGAPVGTEEKSQFDWQFVPTPTGAQLTGSF